jgi:hypothetical protein
MKPPVTTDLANDNGTPEQRLAAATMALHEALSGLNAPVELLAQAAGRKAQPDS